jgi:hypothetical protein
LISCFPVTLLRYFLNLSSSSSSSSSSDIMLSLYGLNDNVNK